MINNGFTPEWIQLSKEIRKEIEELREQLSKVRNNIGELPLTLKDESIWKNNLRNFQTLEKQINIKIDKYNLLVPILQKQMLHIRLDDFAEKALLEPSLKHKPLIKNYADISHKSLNENIYQDLFNFIINLFGKNVS